MKKIWSKIRTFILLFQAFITFSILIISFLLFREKNVKLRKIWSKIQMFLFRIKIIEVGKRDSEAQMIITNHQSMLDIPVLESVHPADLCWIGKKELGDITFFGHLMKAPRMILLDREDKKSLIKLISDVKSKVEEGRPVIIFPEGTRVQDFEKQTILPFKGGTKLIGEKLKLKIQPIVMINSGKRLDTKSFNSSSGELKIIYLDSFYPERKTDWLEDIRVKMQKEIDSNI